MKDREMEKCPWCGHTRFSFFYSTRTKEHSIKCDTCGVRVTFKYVDTFDSLRWRWNKRAKKEEARGEG